MSKEEECGTSGENSQDGLEFVISNTSEEIGSDTPPFSQSYYDIEPCYYSLTGKSERNCRGKVYRYRDDGDLKGFQSHDGIMYQLKDSVFVEVSPTEPYMIASISGFKYTKREHVVVKLTRYFRAEDIPEMSLNLMKQERTELNINPHLCPVSLNRELFNSEIVITHPVSCLRGKCTVEYVSDIRQAQSLADFKLDNDTFFFCLHYNQDSTRLASTHYAIRVGPAFQATLPPVAQSSVSEDNDRDELVYRPGSIDEKMEAYYVSFARAFRNFTLSTVSMLDSQKNARIGDSLLDEAICQLHRSGYNPEEALNEMSANDVLLACNVDYMTQEDAKKFARGIKSLGKNFSRIQRDLLPHHSREQLVAYYYLWKKTKDATKPKVNARRVNPSSIKRPTKEKTKVSRPTSTDYLDYDSATESDVENNGPSGRACHHCFGMKSKDWHHAYGLLLCTDCRVHYKKYGRLRHVANRPTQVPACLFKRANSGDGEESGVRTRAGKKEQRKRTPSSMSETPDRTRSPAVTSNGIANGERSLEESPSRRANGTLKRNAKRSMVPVAKEKEEKVKRENLQQQPCCSSSDGSPRSSPTQNSAAPNGVIANGRVKTPNGETVCKKPKLEAGYDEEEEEEGRMTIDEGEENDQNGSEEKKRSECVKIEEQEIEPTTSNHSTEAVNCGEDVKMIDETSHTMTIGATMSFETSNAQFIEVFKRSCGQRSVRTDLQFKVKEGSKWELSLKARQEKQVAASFNASSGENSVATSQAVVAEPTIPIGINHQVQMNANLAAEYLQRHFFANPAAFAAVNHGAPAMQQMQFNPHAGIDAAAYLNYQLMNHPENVFKIRENMMLQAAAREREQREREQREREQREREQREREQREMEQRERGRVAQQMIYQHMNMVAVASAREQQNQYLNQLVCNGNIDLNRMLQIQSQLLSQEQALQRSAQQQQELQSNWHSILSNPAILAQLPIVQNQQNELVRRFNGNTK